MNIQHNISLKSITSFGIDLIVNDFFELTNIADLPALSEVLERKIIGGGSNILCTQTPKGLVIANRTKGIKLIEEDANTALIEVASGEVWHDFVLYTLSQNLNGIENLALIPGTVGAAPIQNIGAYGVEVKDVIDSVIYWDWTDKKMVALSNIDCRFGYRDSIFKNELRNRFFIVSVRFRLSKIQQLQTTYGAINEELTNLNILRPNAKDVAQAVINIRSSKLPNPKEIGNAGSFFKNPNIPIQQYLDLKKRFATIPSYPVNEHTVKVPAGWLIEQCGWKGFRKNDYGVHEKQALVLVNYGNATGEEIWQLSSEILVSVKNTFGIELEREVQVW
ncbi:MAG: UDP-N-acetylmuramate dehydrogenase [Chitinophagaceae bacterium]|nr:UDP-N-acetylmuramate dehydrogenase [Chitinophagaceae bacterium]